MHAVCRRSSADNAAFSWTDDVAGGQQPGGMIDSSVQ